MVYGQPQTAERRRMELNTYYKAKKIADEASEIQEIIRAQNGFILKFDCKDSKEFKIKGETASAIIMSLYERRLELLKQLEEL